MIGALICLGYIDPGTGSVVLQVVVGGAFGVLFLVRNKLRQLVEKLRGIKNPDA